jgi:MFS family permease
MSGAQSESTRALGALQHRDFRLFFVGMLISQVGSQMQLMALNWHIYLLTKSALALGFIGLARILPIIAFALFGGLFADAGDRRRVLLITQTVMMAFAAALALLTLAGHATPASIYLLAATTSAAMAFDAPARQAMIPNLVSEENLSKAIGLNTVIRRLGTVLGPSLGGALIAWKGVAAAYWFNAASFLAVLGALAVMRTRFQEETGASRVNLAALGEGLRFLRSSRIVLSTMVVDFIATFFASASALLPIFADQILRVGPKGLGLLYAAEAVGAVAAALWLSAAASVERKGLAQLWALSVYGVATVLFGASRSFPLTLGLLVVAGAADTVSTVLRNTVRQEITPDRFRGRMTSVNIMFALGGPQLGNMEAGALASLVGTPLSVVAGGVATVVAVAAMAWRNPELRRYAGKGAAPQSPCRGEAGA